ncbi:MAG: hypothetical protein SP1CHLAM54_17780 [Chlamydiia bacterium]|nr:hypothetical protein [Chlamydiia bacterium]MCH9616666.1 hypothetical protein [Chlamydiia bacterium]MCH9629398.1 hypothetical protein [Chlamydiia bacterium]
MVGQVSRQAAAAVPVHGTGQHGTHEARSKDGTLAVVAKDGKKTHKKRKPRFYKEAPKANRSFHAAHHGAVIGAHINKLTRDEQIGALNKLGLNFNSEEGRKQIKGLLQQAQNRISQPSGRRDVFFAVAIVAFMLAAVKGNNAEMMAGVGAVKLQQNALKGAEAQLGSIQTQLTKAIGKMDTELHPHHSWLSWGIPLFIGIGALALGPALGALAEGAGAVLCTAFEAMSGFVDAGADVAVEGAVDTTVETTVDSSSTFAAGGGDDIGNLDDAVEDTYEEGAQGGGGGGLGVDDSDAAEANQAKEANTQEAEAKLQRANADETGNDLNRIEEAESGNEGDDGKVKVTKTGDNEYEDSNGRKYRQKDDKWEKESNSRKRWRDWKNNRLSSIKGEGENGVLGRYLPGMKSAAAAPMLAMTSVPIVQQELTSTAGMKAYQDADGASQTAQIQSGQVKIKTQEEQTAMSTIQQQNITSAENANNTIASETYQALQAISQIGSLGQGG